MTWSSDELDAVGAAEELLIGAAGGSTTRGVPIWVVRVGDALYVRSWKGTGGGWYRRAVRDGTAHVRAASVERDVRVVAVSEMDDAVDAVDAAYRSKYARYGATYVRPMVAPDARATTLRLDTI